MDAGTASPRLAFVLNGRPAAIDLSSPERALRTTLLDFVRNRGLTGAKEGCAEGECGACAVAVVTGADGPGSRYRVVNSCLVPLVTMAGHEVLTVEGLSSAAGLTDAQTAMAAAGGSQCGYCTPGFVVSLFAEQYRPGREGPCDPLAMAGNLCRCTGYRPIREAALSLGPPPAGMLLARLSQTAPPLESVDARVYTRPRSVDACLRALRAHPSATLVAGATDLGVEHNLKGRRFEHLIGVDAIDELVGFSDTPEHIRIGAALPLADIGRRWTSAPPAVRDWLELFASPLIRNRATLGGNLATASPIGDAAPLLLALDASVDIAGGGEGALRRRVPIADFFTAYRRTRIGAGGLITHVVIPKPLPARLRFYKVAKRRLDDISTVAAAFALDLDEGGIVSRVRLAFGGVAATPVRARDAESSLAGAAWSAAAVERAQGAIVRTLSPLSDHRGSSAYRRDVSASLLAKFWTEARP